MKKLLCNVAALFAIALFVVACSEDTVEDGGSVPLVNFELPKEDKGNKFDSISLIDFEFPEEDEGSKFDSISLINVPLVDFELPEWAPFKPMPSFTLFVFRSQEELRKCLSYRMSSPPPPMAIDFDKYSLLYAHGSTPNQIDRVEKSMVKRGENDYLLEVNVKDNILTAIGEWQILVLMPAIETEANIEFVKKLYGSNGNGEYYHRIPNWGEWD